MQNWVTAIATHHFACMAQHTWHSAHGERHAAIPLLLERRACAGTHLHPSSHATASLLLTCGSAASQAPGCASACRFRSNPCVTLATHQRFCSLQIANCCCSKASQGATFLVTQGEDTTNVRRKRSMLEAEGVVFNIKMQECKVALTSVVQLDELTKLCAGLGR